MTDVRGPKGAPIATSVASLDGNASTGTIQRYAPQDHKHAISMIGGLAAGTQTAASGTVQLSNSNGLSFGMSGSSRITASMDAWRPGVAITTLPYIDFQVNITSWTANMGRVGWDTQEHALRYSDEIDHIHTGRQTVVYVKNVSGVPIAAGSVVRISGASGDRPKIDLAKADAESTSYPLGVVISTISDNGEGNVVTGGICPFDTQSYTAGDAIYLSETVAGGIQLTEVVAPNHNVRIGTVLNKKSAATGGLIVVKINLGSEIEELHNVRVTNLADQNVLAWQSSASVWQNTTMAAGGGAAIQGSGTYSQNTGTVQFANSHNVTFGLSANGMMTASASMPAGAGDGWNPINAGGSTGNSTMPIQFGNANGISFSLNGSTVTASHNALTTAAASNHTHGSGPSITGPVSVTSNSTGWSISLSNYITTAANSTAESRVIGIAGSAASTASGNVQFANGNGVTFGLSANSVMTASHNGLTTAAASNHTHGSNPSITGPVSVTSNSTGWSISLSNYITTAANSTAESRVIGIAGSAASTASGNVQFANSNGITFGLSANSVMTASHNGLTTAAASGHTHGSGPSITGSISVTSASNAWSISIPAFLTTARASNDAVGLNSALTANGVSATVNSSGLSLNFPAFLTTAQPVGAYLTTARASNDAIGLNSALTANGLSVTANSSGLSINCPAFLTTAAASTAESRVIGIAGSNASTASGNVQFANSHNVTFGLNGNTITASASMPPGSGDGWNPLAAGGSTGNSTMSIVFGNANGVSFSLNGSTITASHNGLTTAAASDHSHGNPTLALTNLTGTTASASNGFTISLSGNAAGGGSSLSEWMPFNPNDRGMGTFTIGQNSLMFAQLPDLMAPLVVSRVNLYALVSCTFSSGAGSGGITYSAALYGRDSAQTDIVTSLWSHSIYHRDSRSASTQAQMTYPVGIDTVNSSVSYSNYAATNATASQQYATSVAGQRPLMLPCYTTLTPGRYYFAWGRSTQTQASYTLGFNLIGMNWSNTSIFAGFAPMNVNSSATNAGYFGIWRVGSYATTTASFPGSITITNNDIRNIPSMTIPYMDFRGYTTNGTVF